MVEYVERMYRMLEEERKNGLVGMKFCAIPKDGPRKLDHEKLAKAFCDVFGKKSGVRTITLTPEEMARAYS